MMSQNSNSNDVSENLESLHKTKQCNICKKMLPANNLFFNKDKSSKSGLRSFCRKCGAARAVEYRKLNKEKCEKYSKEYYKKNKTKVLESCATYRGENKEKRSLTLAKYTEKNKELIAKKKKVYREKNKENYEEYRKKYVVDNREKILKRSREYYIKNKDKIKERYTQYSKNNKDKIAARACERNKRPASYSTYHERLSLVEEIKESEVIKDALCAKCTYCGRWFTPKLSAVTSRLNAINIELQGEGRLYCSQGCKDSCPTYKRIKNPKNFKSESSREANSILRKIVLQRDNYSCQKCSISIDDGAVLHCHHVVPATQNPMTANDPDVCITLCKTCHKEVHRQEGCKYHELKCEGHIEAKHMQSENLLMMSLKKM